MNKRQFSVSKKITIISLFVLLFLSAQLILSCNGNKTKEKKNQFKISVDLIAYQNSHLQVFYKMSADERYYEAFSLKKDVKKSTSLQHIIFEFPSGIKPKNLRIDLGDTENDSVRVENIRLRYKNRELNGNHGAYKAWFDFNENVIQGKDSLTFHLKKVNGFFDPQMNGNQVLNSKMVKLFPPDINEF